MTDSTHPARPLSPARAHLQRIAASQAAAPAQASAAGSEHEVLMAQLYEHTRQLKAIKSVEKKIEAKRESQQSTGDGMPAITSSAALPEPKPKPKADPWSQAIDQEVTKRKKLV